MTIEVKVSTTAPTAKNMSGAVIVIPSMTTPDVFQEGVKAMDRKDLNSLDMRFLLPWAKTIVYTERCRRKSNGQPLSVLNKNPTSTTNVVITRKKPVSSGTVAKTAKTSTTTPKVNAIGSSSPPPPPPLSSSASTAFSSVVTSRAKTSGSCCSSSTTLNQKTKLLVTKATTAEQFKEMIMTMDRKALNTIDIRTLPTWARSLLHNERCLRKNIETSPAPTPTTAKTTSTMSKTDKTIHSLAISFAHVPAKVDLLEEPCFTLSSITAPSYTRRVEPVAGSHGKAKVNFNNSYGTSSSTRLYNHRRGLGSYDSSRITSKNSNTCKSALKSSNNRNSSDEHVEYWIGHYDKTLSKSFKPLQEEDGKTIDGRHLHDALVLAALDPRLTILSKDCEIVYDEDLIEYTSYFLGPTAGCRRQSREMKGRFECLTCTVGDKDKDKTNNVQRKRDGPRNWDSNVIFTEFWYRNHRVNPQSLSRGIKDTFSYRSLIHSQRCRGCEKYMKAILDPVVYIDRALKAIEIWSGRRKPIERDEEEEEEGDRRPHDRDRCHGCDIGRCRKGGGQR
ncbi:hypothetical protein BGZ83_012059 [Gryganskiella cystojenkinii]|nr:hypothetical protein BGZ83_012059 [Gryganskiella cystojenkinii]